MNFTISLDIDIYFKYRLKLKTYNKRCFGRSEILISIFVGAVKEARGNRHVLKQDYYNLSSVQPHGEYAVHFSYFYEKIDTHLLLSARHFSKFNTPTSWIQLEQWKHRFIIIIRHHFGWSIRVENFHWDFDDEPDKIQNRINKFTTKFNQIFGFDS